MAVGRTKEAEIDIQEAKSIQEQSNLKKQKAMQKLEKIKNYKS